MLPEQVLSVARSQIGTKESPANSNKTKYGAWYGQDGQPWCAMFVSWCFYTAGAPLHITTDKGYAYCPYGVNFFQKSGRWSSTPLVGSIVFYGSGGTAVHTGIVESFDQFNITTIEGNTAVGNDANGGEVMRRTRPRNNWVIGYGLPVYTQPTQPKAIYGPATQLGDTVIKQEMTTLPLDDQGRGYIDTHIPFEKFLGVAYLGLHPARDGWDNPEWNVPAKWSHNNTDGQATVVFTGGTPGKPVHFIAESAN